jgi:mannose-6-phosphate isomerase-like protein (cupin superfamily)
MTKALLIVALVAGAAYCQAPPAAKKKANQVSQTVWSPKATKLPGWTGPHKPHTKLADVLAAHKGKANWSHTIVDDEHLHAEYIQMAAGESTRRRMHPDTREWWVVQSGKIRFTIDGQEPFVASKGYLVQVPYRTFYKMETVGSEPSLRFEVNIAKAKTQYPSDEKPPDVPGYEFLKTTVAGQGKYEGGNRPFIDFANVVNGTESQRRFIADDRAVSNIIFGDVANLAPAKDSDKGHFHPECAEFWVVLLGTIEYKMEGAGMIYATEGDIVYAPRMHWHRPRFGGSGNSARLAMNGYQDISHLFEAH